MVSERNLSSILTPDLEPIPKMEIGPTDFYQVASISTKLGLSCDWLHYKQSNTFLVHTVSPVYIYYLL